MAADEMPWTTYERTLLRAAVHNGALVGIVALEPEDFEHDAFRATWRCCQHLYHKGRPLSLENMQATLTEYLRENDRTPDEVRRLIGALPRLYGGECDTSPLSALDTARQIKEFALVRQAERDLGALQQMAANHDRAVLAGIRRLAAGLPAQDNGDHLRTWSDVLTDMHADLTNRASGRIVPVPTGITALDSLSLFQPGEYVILAARTSIGKSALAMNIAAHAADKKYQKGDRVPADKRWSVLYVSMEMRDIQLAKRVMSSRAGIPAPHLRSGALPPDEERRLDAAHQAQYDWRLAVMDRGRRDIDAVLSRARQVRATIGLDLLVVDYIQTLHRDQTSSRKTHEQIAAMSSAFKDVAGELGCAVLCLAQLNRNSDVTDDRRPRLSDLKDSGALEQDADAVLLLSPVLGNHSFESWRDQDVRPVLLDVAKSRDGETTDIPLVFLKQQLLFGEQDRHAYP